MAQDTHPAMAKAVGNYINSQLIMLDTRSFKSAWVPREGGEHPFFGRWQPSDDPKKTILGEEQWAWLEAQLSGHATIDAIDLDLTAGRIVIEGLPMSELV